MDKESKSRENDYQNRREMPIMKRQNMAGLITDDDVDFQHHRRRSTDSVSYIDMTPSNYAFEVANRRVRVMMLLARCRCRGTRPIVTHEWHTDGDSTFRTRQF